MTDRSRDALAVFATGALLGVAILGNYAVNRPGTFGLNYRVYHVAAEAALAGGDLYAVTPADSGYHYVYPPAAVLAFLPSALFESWVPGFLAMTAVSVAASAVAARLLADYVESLGYDVGRLERVLLFSFLLASAHSAPSLGYGQVNHVLTLALVAGFVGLARDRETGAGVALAVPAFVKVFPAAVGLWLLRRRAWRAIGAAVGTAASLFGLGLVVFGVDTTRTYVTDALLPQRETADFVGGLPPGKSFVTLRRPLSVLFPNADPVWYAVGAAALLAPVLAALYYRPRTVTDRHVAVHGTLVAMVLAFPSLLLYYAYTAFSLVVLLYDLPAGRGRQLFVAGALLANVSLSYGNLRETLWALPVGPTARQAILDAALPVLRLGTPVLWGSLLTLAGCLVYRVESGALSVPAPLRGVLGDGDA
ncbi:glycosyltransferase family 87 protein [Halosimplex halophilum]|uniref:glycosyltransferase family 87 protein n=1 Tax=Halosimplex halophilum TaxID=2559572 RepID=UPI00107F94A0|nr:glycosyltransferase family 87 protein [Halosimplex halophilum]